jgi:hypothetical protein
VFLCVSLAPWFKNALSNIVEVHKEQMRKGITMRVCSFAALRKTKPKTGKSLPNVEGKHQKSEYQPGRKQI